MVLVTQFSIPVLKQFAPKISSNPRAIFVFEIVGSVKRFQEHDGFLVLCEPPEHPLLTPIYKNQQEIIHAITDELKKIQREDEDEVLCYSCVHTSFEDDGVSSTLRVYVPEDLLPLMKDMPRGQAIKIKSCLAYSELSNSLNLSALTIDIISNVKVVVK